MVPLVRSPPFETVPASANSGLPGLDFKSFFQMNL
jgi:hypothetical protein